MAPRARRVRAHAVTVAIVSFALVRVRGSLGIEQGSRHDCSRARAGAGSAAAMRFARAPECPAVDCRDTRGNTKQDGAESAGAVPSVADAGTEAPKLAYARAWNSSLSSGPCNRRHGATSERSRRRQHDHATQVDRSLKAIVRAAATAAIRRRRGWRLLSVGCERPAGAGKRASATTAADDRLPFADCVRVVAAGR
jgi:hypothetical protein